jgi:hypothetical protein
MREIMVRLLSVAPKTSLYKEFFGFLREIFYYNRDMDEVDFDLANDTLYILNNLLKTSSNVQQRELFHKLPYLSENNALTVQDHFRFTDFSPGVILHDSFKIPQESFSISLLFKVNLAQVRAM